MKRALLLLALGLGVPFSACLNLKPCATDGECMPSGRCDPQGFCVFDPDSGVNGGGGGVMSGGGGGMTGGGGGMTGGGGGMTGGGGGMTGGGGGTSGGGGGMSGGGGGMTGGGGGMTGGGGGTLPFCSVNCTAPAECQPTTTGGVCVPGTFVLRFESPTSGQAFNGPDAGTVSFVVTARWPDGGSPNLTSIPFTCPGLSAPAALPSMGTGVFGVAVAIPPVTTSYVATAGWDGGPVTNVAFSANRLPPMITLEFPAGSPFQRDAIVPVAIRSSRAVTSLSLTLTGTDGGVTTQAVLTGVTSVCANAGLVLNGFDRCGTLDLAAPAMAAMTANFMANVSGSDSVGNSDARSFPIAVTRLKWRASVGGAVRAAPALDSQGNLFIGTDDTSFVGRLISFTPEGGTRFTLNMGAVQSVSVAESDLNNGGLGELAYVSTVTASNAAALRGIFTDGGSPMLTMSNVCTDLTRPTSTAIALFDAGVASGRTEVGAVMLFNAVPTGSQDGVLCRWGPRSGASSSTASAGMNAPEVDGASVFSPLNLVALGNKGWLQRSDTRLNYLELSPIASGGTNGTFTAGAFPTGLSIATDVLIGAYGGANALFPLATYPLDNSNVGTTFASTTYPIARAPVALAGSLVCPTNRTGPAWLISMTQSGPTLANVVQVAAPSAGNFNSAATSAVVGTNNTIYIINRAGQLNVYDATAANGIGAQSPAWSTTLFMGTVDLVAHPTLDCSRRGAGRPGTLYAVTLDGQVVAVIVDSTKLEPTAPWPKWQRTAGNAGNPAFALNPGCP